MNKWTNEGTNGQEEQMNEWNECRWVEHENGWTYFWPDHSPDSLQK